jgi:hypothetical protein
MILTKEEIKEFETITRPLIEWLNGRGHPHFTAIIDNGRAELTEGKCSFVTDDYIMD